MGLSRIKLGERLFKSLAKKVKPLGFELFETEYDETNHTASYSCKKDNILYEVTVRVFKSYYLNLEAHFHSYYDEINDFIKTIEFNEEYRYSTIDVIFNSHYDTILIGKDKVYSTFNQEDLDKIVELTYQRFFINYVVDYLIPMTDTIPKLNKLINNEERLNREDVDISPTMIIDFQSEILKLVMFNQSQVLNGVVLALICKNNNYQEIIKRYIKYIDFDFVKDEDETIELVYKIIEKYEPKLLKISNRKI